MLRAAILSHTRAVSVAVEAATSPDQVMISCGKHTVAAMNERQFSVTCKKCYICDISNFHVPPNGKFLMTHTRWALSISSERELVLQVKLALQSALRTYMTKDANVDSESNNTSRPVPSGNSSLVLPLRFHEFSLPAIPPYVSKIE